MAETTYVVSLISTDPSKAVDHFYKFRGERLPEEGEIIDVVRFVRGRAVRARVTRASLEFYPPIEATQIG